MSEIVNVRNFENVKVGDPVIYHSRYGCHVTSVTRVTKTCFAVACDGTSLYRKDGGDRRGGGTWDFNHCTIATKESVTAVEAEQKKKDLLVLVNSKIRRLNFKSLSIEQLEELHSVLDKFLGE